MCKSRIILAGLLFILSTGAIAQREFVVDNQDENVSKVGDWRVSSGPDPYLGESLYSGNRESVFIWWPNLSGHGEYDVYAWWTYHPNRSRHVPYRVWDGQAMDVTMIVNQRDPAMGGGWNWLGRFTFVDGTIPRVVVSSSNGQASADAVKFVEVTGAVPVTTACWDDENRYIDCGNGTVTDTVTGLVWTKDAGSGTSSYAGTSWWAPEIMHGQGGLTDGSENGDWRLPTQAEWAATIEQAVNLGCTSENGYTVSLTDVTGTRCFEDGEQPFENINKFGYGTYWSSTAVAEDPNYAYVWNIRGDAAEMRLKSESTQGWFVRTAPP